MTRNARLQLLLVLCVVCLIVVPAMAAAQTAARPVPSPAERLPGDGRPTVESRIFHPALAPSSLAPSWLDELTVGLGPRSLDGTGIGRSADGVDPDGNWRRLVFQAYLSDLQYDLFVVRDMSSEFGSQVVRLTATGTNEVQPAISPDGNRIAFASKADSDYDIYVASYNYNTESLGPAIKLTNNNYDEFWPVWSADGKRLAFYGIIDGNEANSGRSDIFVMNADGSGLANLTNYPGVDAFPGWSPDGTKIVFSSRRTGGYRIHVMDANGGNVRQLSNHPDSLRPAWSPDGTKIAYTADYDSDGWFELVTMNADGTGQRLLRDQNGPYVPEDFEVRGWSPVEGFITYTRVHWIFIKGNWYIDEADLRYITSDTASMGEVMNVPFSFEPYMASIDHQPPQTSITPLPAESPYQFTVRWGGRDVGPAGLDTFDAQMQIDDGPWTNMRTGTTFTEYEIRGSGGQRFSFRSRGRDFAGNVEPWPAVPNAVTVIETHPPISRMKPLPPFTWVGENMPVELSARDVGGSGVFNIDSNFRRNGGAWQAWSSDKSSFPPDRYGVEGGDRVDFRVRSVDFASNVEPWPPDPGNATTTFYALRLSGWAIDNSGNRVGGATATAAPVGLNPVASSIDGRYNAYLAAAVPSLSLQWAKPGYGALPLFTRVMTRNRGAMIVMPPADDVVANGGFEAGGWGAWQPGGSVPPTLINDTERVNIGHGAAALGAAPATFGAPEPVTNTPDVIEYSPDMAIDGDDNAFVVWKDETGELYSRTRRANGTWDGIVSLPNGVEVYYHLTRSPDGLLWLGVWSDGVLYVWRQSGYGWSAIGPVPGTEGLSSYELAAGPGNRLDVTWFDSERQIQHVRWANGAWSAKTWIHGPSGIYWYTFSTAAAPDGSFHIAWMETDGGRVYVSHRRLTPDGVWGPDSEIFHKDAYRFALSPDAGGRLHFGLQTYAAPMTGVFYRSWADGKWGPLELLGRRDISFDAPVFWQATADGAVQTLLQESGEVSSFMRRETDGQVVVDPLPREYGKVATMVTDPGGGAHFVFIMKNSDDKSAVYYLTRSVAGEWSEPVEVAHSDNEITAPQLGLNAAGLPTIVWRDLQNYAAVWKGDLSFAGPKPATSSDESTLTQQLTVPASMARPILSFVYRSAGSVRLEIAEPGGAILHTRDLPPSPAGMRHDWLDLSAWGGRTLQITFRRAQTAGGFPSWAVIDDVSLGAAHLDIGVTGASGEWRLDDTVRHTLRVRNGSLLAANNVALTYELPGALAFVVADPAPSSLSPLRWNLGTVASGQEIVINITTAVTSENPPPVVSAVAGLTTTTPELETLNNSAEIVSQLEPPERLIFLPATMRPD